MLFVVDNFSLLWYNFFMKKEVKQKIIDILLNSQDYVSGESIAREAKVSRSAVWKHIENLKKEGYEIEGVKNRGYRLVNVGNHLNEKILASRLSHILTGGVVLKKQVSSTNKLLRQMAEEGCGKDCLLIANSQTDGIGRYGRKFFSPADSGIYFSLLLKPNCEISLTTNVTVAMAVAVAQSIEETLGKQCLIKWVNDLLIEGKKVCGILTEGSIDVETMSMNFVVVGVGINLYRPTEGFDHSIKDIAGGLLPADEKKSLDKNLLVEKIIKNFYDLLKDLRSPRLAESYRARLAYVGERVQVLKNGQPIDEGQVLGVDDQFKLKVRLRSNGEIQSLDSGEISTRLTK